MRPLPFRADLHVALVTSPSQFSREFKRFFGRTPAEDTRDMRASFALSPAAKIDDFAASH